ncbi:MAG TPA: PqqD family protein [Candidatus Methylomirabilis sp.]|nr:PqqD family protein [Candidatus Methylomirabilis sp.]
MSAWGVNREDIAWRVVDDEAVIINSETSDYFSLNLTGTWLWTLMEQPRTREDLAAALTSRYGQPLGAVQADVTAFLDDLTSARLLVPSDQPSPLATATAVAATSPPRDAYEPPQLVRFGNLETLILSGE